MVFPVASCISQIRHTVTARPSRTDSSSTSSRLSTVTNPDSCDLSAITVLKLTIFETNDNKTDFRLYTMPIVDERIGFSVTPSNQSQDRERRRRRPVRARCDRKWSCSRRVWAQTRRSPCGSASCDLYTIGSISIHLGKYFPMEFLLSNNILTIIRSPHKHGHIDDLIIFYFLPIDTSAVGGVQVTPVKKVYCTVMSIQISPPIRLILIV
jgi:hypothetical protein